MSRGEDERNTLEVSRLLAGAARAIANVRYCWLTTAAEAGGVNSRPMGRVPPDPGESEWKIRFVTDGRSRKVSEIRRANKAGIIFQHDPDEAFVTLAGTATLHEERSEIGRRWKRAYDTYFPSERDRANAAFIEVDVERMELWIRGVTPEPFGLHATVLERSAGGVWRLVPAGGDAQ